MIGLAFFLVVGVGFLAAFLLLGAKGRTTVPDVSAVTAVAQMVRLGGLSFTNSRRLLDDAEYRILLSNPQLQRVARRLRADRQELILQWLTVLLSDLKALWRFRRLLVRHGAPVQPAEELKVLRTFVCCWALLITIRCSVRIAGPFAVPVLVREAKAFVGGMSDTVAGTLSRLPAAAWPEIERRWAAQTA